MDIVSLCLTGKLCRLRIKKGGIIAGAVIGALFSFAVTVFSPDRYLKFVLTFVCSCFMVVISFGKGKWLQVLRRATVLWAAGGLIGGVITAVAALGMIQSGTKSFFFVLSISVVAVILMTRIILRRPVANVSFVKVSFSGRIAAFSGLVDSGNLLCDPFSGTPVIIISPDVAKKILREDELRYLTGVASEDVPQTLVGRIRFIPSKTVGAECLLRALRPDFVTVDGITRDVLVATTFSSRDLGKYDGIIPSCVAVAN